MYVCTFTIFSYGFSGNELPPPVSRTYSRSVLSGGSDNIEIFTARMYAEGNAIRDLLKRRFEEKPRPYSCADGCDWLITPVGSVTELVKEIGAQ